MEFAAKRVHAHRKQAKKEGKKNEAPDLPEEEINSNMILLRFGTLGEEKVWNFHFTYVSGGY
jgi:hypothetical protein